MSLQSLEIFFPDCLCLWHELHRAPAMHHPFSDVHIQFYSVFFAYTLKILQICDHHFSGSVENVDRWKSGILGISIILLFVVSLSPHQKIQHSIINAGKQQGHQCTVYAPDQEAFKMMSKIAIAATFFCPRNDQPCRAYRTNQEPIHD